MKASKLLFLMLVLTFTFFSHAQDKPTRFTSGELGIKIDLPVQPTKGEDTSFTLLDFNVWGVSIVWDEGEKQFASMGIYRPYKRQRGNLTEIDKTKVLDEYKKTFVSDLQDRKVMTTETPYTFQGFKGVEIRGAGPMRLLTRMFFSGYKMYVISVSNAETAGFDKQIKVLDSFALLTKSETVSALKWENDPNELPQTPAGKRSLTDVQSDMLKGKVQSIVEEVQNTPTASREMSAEKYYDQAGNLTRNVTYNLGYPQEITQWGWIDGKRVSSTNVVYYDLDSDGEESKYRGIGTRTGLMGQQTEESAYGAHHEYKYDDRNHVTEWKSFSPDGSLRFTYKYIYTPTGREIQELDNTGGFLKRSFEVYDKDGNMTEYRTLDFSGKVYSTVRYTYEFDPGGNWTVRRLTSGGPGAAKTTKPGAVTYRKITYYENPKT